MLWSCPEAEDNEGRFLYVICVVWGILPELNPTYRGKTKLFATAPGLSRYWKGEGFFHLDKKYLCHCPWAFIRKISFLLERKLPVVFFPLALAPVPRT